MRFEGTLKSWNDDKGFGSISPILGGQDIFVHISDYPRGRRPVLNESLTFEVELNPQSKKRAVNVQSVGTKQAAQLRGGGSRPIRVSRSGNLIGSGLRTVVGLLLVALLGWQGFKYYQKAAPAHRANEPAPSAGQPLLDLAPSRTATASYVCDGRQHCSQMTSCAEATYFLKNCPGTKMDGDKDGVPCEVQLCR